MKPKRKPRKMRRLEKHHARIVRTQAPRARKGGSMATDDITPVA